MAKTTKGPIGDAQPVTVLVTGGAITRGYGAIKGTNDDEVAIAGAAAAVLGVMQETTAQNALGPMVKRGEFVAIAGGAIVQGDWVKTDSAGKFVASAGEDTANGGRARSSAAADGDEFILDVAPVKKRS